MKETSVTTRLRVVFDASCKMRNGVSLNDALLVGPVIQQDLFSILIRFRSFEYVVTADIAKMYRQIMIDEAQVPLQCIVWRDHLMAEEIKTYELLTLTYGTAPASFLTTRATHQLAELEECSYSKGALIARRNVYMDNLITEANTKEDARLINETTALLQKGGFMLR